MSEKKKKNVPTAEAQKESTSSPDVSVAVPERPVTAAPSILELAKGLPDDKVKMAEELGIPIRGLLEWAYAVEVQLVEIQKTLPDTIKKKMAEAIEDARQKQPVVMATAGTTPTTESRGISLKDLLTVFGSAGGGVDAQTAYYAEMGKRWGDLGNFALTEILKKSVPDLIASYEASKKAAAGATS